MLRYCKFLAPARPARIHQLRYLIFFVCLHTHTRHAMMLLYLRSLALVRIRDAMALNVLLSLRNLTHVDDAALLYVLLHLHAHTPYAMFWWFLLVVSIYPPLTPWKFWKHLEAIPQRIAWNNSLSITLLIDFHCWIDVSQGLGLSQGCSDIFECLYIQVWFREFRRLFGVGWKFVWDYLRLVSECFGWLES
jgi:hypothetical protein